MQEGLLKNEYGYNEKELWDEADLYWYEYGFRNYDAQIGRFVQIDPLADISAGNSGYHYALNDPIANIDYLGLSALDMVRCAWEMSSSLSNLLSVSSVITSIATGAINVAGTIANQQTAIDQGRQGPGLSSPGNPGSRLLPDISLKGFPPDNSLTGRTLRKAQKKDKLVKFRFELKGSDSNEDPELNPIMPVDAKYHVTSGYTESKRSIPELRQNRPHRAIDIGTPFGKPILSPWDGKVLDANTADYGQYIIISHYHKMNGQSVSTSYSHLSKMVVTKGDNVERGQIIGYTGKYGTGPHLHFVLKVGGKKVNPKILFPYK